ncbi:hypothetical protein Syun_005816 [Stephania yunnanensis]|uniref:Uncharacterized protein n=1 Tax=Stephania yunnanensis TaxID=152371 RepID=A0AAP0PY14_9MAGN
MMSALSSSSTRAHSITHHHHHQWRLRFANPNPSLPLLSTTAKTSAATSITSRSLGGNRRRHHHRRRRGLRRTAKTKNPSFSPSSPPSSSSSSSDQKLEMVIDVEGVLDRASRSVRRILAELEARFDEFVWSGEEALSDLRTLVMVDPDRRVVVSFRRSSVRFIASCVIWSVVVVVVARVLVGVVVSLWSGDGGGGQGGDVVKRRDRSLGGREVVVGKMDRRGFDFKARPSIVDNPLSASVRGGAVAALRDEAYKLGVSRRSKLPKWWPDSVSVSSSGPSAVADQELHREAQRVIRAIMDNRMSGKDFTEDDIIQVRRICRKSGARVYIETANARDSFYRASVEFVLNTCCSSRIYSMELQLDGEDPRQFVAGLAGSLGLESIVASRIVSAGVAARTRSYFLQAWALEMQGKRNEAEMELSKICSVHKTFPPDESSPEMEMVARGLERHLKIEQREQLLNLLQGICDAESSKSAAEALGLEHTDLLS